MNDRERLIDILYKGFYISPENDIKGTAQKAADYLISHGVTVQKHGRWEGLEYDGYADGCPVYDLWECSECGEEKRGEDVPDTHPYCPNCGAKMEKGEA